MTKDTRLGADPLAWLGAGPAIGKEETPGEDRPAQAGGGDPARQRIIRPGSWPVSEDDMGKSGKIKLEQAMDTAQALAHLQDVVESMKSGVLEVESGDESLSIPVAPNLELEMKIARKKGKAKCSISLEWEIDPEAEIPGVTIGGKDQPAGR